MGQYSIDYAGQVTRSLKADKRSGSKAKRTFEDVLFDVLPDLWCDAYARMPGRRIDIVQVSDDYEFLFDLGCERVVAAFGISRFNPERRDSSRMAGFLGEEKSAAKLDALAKAAPNAREAKRRRHLAGLSFRERFFETHGDRYDRGHFMSHRQGGQLDINLFPQLASVNQGKSVEGKVYRAMETDCAANPDTFCFSRPIYDDDTWVPIALEYGIFRSPTSLQHTTFPNR